MGTEQGSFVPLRKWVHDLLTSRDNVLSCMAEAGVGKFPRTFLGKGSLEDSAEQWGSVNNSGEWGSGTRCAFILPASVSFKGLLSGRPCGGGTETIRTEQVSLFVT